MAEETDNPTARLLDELDDDVEFVEQGVFTVDVEKAGDKLQRFQLAGPAHWILLALEAGLALAPRQVLVTGSLEGVDLVFEGVQLEPAELERTGARSLGTKLGSASREQALELLGYAVDAGEHSRAHGRIYLSSRGLCVEVRGDPCQEELALARANCWAAAIPVLVEFHRVSHGPKHPLDPARGSLPVELDGREVGVAGFPKPSQGEGALYLTRHGVVYERIPLQRASGPAPCAVVDLSLPRDLSLTHFLRQAEYEALDNAIHAMFSRLDAHARATQERARLDEALRPRDEQDKLALDDEQQGSMAEWAVYLFFLLLATIVGLFAS